MYFSLAGINELPINTAKTEKIDARKATITIIVLLSYLSERYPTRYWLIAPPMIKVNINMEPGAE